jgi:hypothetical protein
MKAAPLRQPSHRASSPKLKYPRAVSILQILELSFFLLGAVCFLIRCVKFSYENRMANLQFVVENHVEKNADIAIHRQRRCG